MSKYGWVPDRAPCLAVFDPAGAEIDGRRVAAAPEGLRYQPIRRLRDRTMIGVEAFARGQRPGHPEPARSIPAAERTGLLENACRQGAAWQRAGHNLLISVNLSPVRLGDATLAAHVSDILHRTGLPAARLQLEIPQEAAILEHRETLTRLAGLGVRLALDGFSSLTALATLPFTEAKLSAELLNGPAARILGHAISLCHAAGVTVTAEGIETAEREGLLRELRCDHVQGFRFGHPVPAGQII